MIFCHKWFTPKKDNCPGQFVMVIRSSFNGLSAMKVARESICIVFSVRRRVRVTIHFPGHVTEVAEKL